MTVVREEQLDVDELLTSKGWRGLISEFERVAEEVVFGDPRVDSPLRRAEGLRYVTRLFEAGRILLLEASDPAYPHLVRIESPWLQHGAPNPDFDYMMAPVHGDYTYRLFGNRSTAHLFGLEIMLGGGWERFWETHVVADLTDFLDGTRELEVGPNGEFEVVLSQKEHSGNWVQLPPGESWLLHRQGFSDWENEWPVEIYLEREGAAYPAPTRTAQQLASGLQKSFEFLSGWAQKYANDIGQIYALDPGTVPFTSCIWDWERDDDRQVGFMGQYYGQGHYRCTPDQAVILEVEPPPCAYWMVQTTNHFWEGMDWHLRQTSINGHQAVLDSDGKFRAVIAHEDPGVPNWLDTGGNPMGLIAGRFNRPTIEPVPNPTLQVVPLATLRDILPADTPVVSPSERQEILRKRAIAVQRRKLY